MQDRDPNQHGDSIWAWPASIGVHLVAVALLVFGLPKALSNPQSEQAVNVELVPPPKPVEKAKPTPLAKAETKAPPPVQAPSPRATLRAVQPALHYGEKDSGSRKSIDGDSPDDASQKAAAPPELDKTVDTAELTAIPKPGKPAPERAREPAKPAKVHALTRAKTLFSTAVTDNPVAMAAIGKMPREKRGGTLCGTELREQLIRGLPPYFPNLLPSVPLESGNVIDVEAAFHAAGEWRAISYRCTVDANATRVVSFAFSVGAAIPRSEWQRLGLLPQ